MTGLSISEVAKRVGLRTSALRYYEEIGLIDPAIRVAGQRRYDETVFYRLSIVQRAQQAGFTLQEIHELFSGFVEGTAASERWKQLSERKLAELASKAAEIEFMQGLLHEMMKTCHCDTLETCGKGIFQQTSGLGEQGVSNCCAPKPSSSIARRTLP